MPSAFGPARKDSPRRQTPDWLMLIYGLAVMLLVQTAYKIMSRRAYAASRRAMKRAMRYSEDLLESPMEAAQVRAAAPSRLHS